MNLTGSSVYPNLYFRGGRLELSMSVSLGFVVDTVGSTYPNYTACVLTGSCVDALTLNLTLFIALDLWNTN